MTRDLPSLVAELHAVAGALRRRVQIMEVCGTHTVSVFRHGLRALLPGCLRLISGPGCPVCVTAQRHIDAAIDLSRIPGVILCTYGDMVRVPGKTGSLEQSRAAGADVRVVGSALAAVKIAAANPERQVVFVAVGFETTAPATAVAIQHADRAGLANFSALIAHKLVTPAMAALLDDPGAAIDGFLCPGHVSVIIGAEAFRSIVEGYRRPCVIAGFEPTSILEALTAIVRQISGGRAGLENAYTAAVGADGNVVARRRLDEVFEVSDEPWRELGVIPRSGLRLRPEYAGFDAVARFHVTLGEDVDHPGCRCGAVIQGRLDPDQCPLFGTVCTPLKPLGPCMVSSEGTCSAWFKYRRSRGAAEAGGAIRVEAVAGNGADHRGSTHVAVAAGAPTAKKGSAT